VSVNVSMPVRVIGCGSPQGDDALAWEVIRQLRCDARLPVGVELQSIDGGHRLLDVLDGRGTLVLVDAVSPGGDAGAIHRFEWPDDRLDRLRPGTTHHMRPVEALELAATLGMLPPRVVVFGIEATSLEASGSVSNAVAAALPAVVDRIVEELGDARIIAAQGSVQAD
jgi:hydrogenase maturation protease